MVPSSLHRASPVVEGALTSPLRDDRRQSPSPRQGAGHVASIRLHLDMLRGSLDPWHSSGSKTGPPLQPGLGQWLETSSSRPQGCHGNMAGGHFRPTVRLSAGPTGKQDKATTSPVLPTEGPFIPWEPPGLPLQQQSEGSKALTAPRTLVGSLTPTQQASPGHPPHSVCMVVTTDNLCGLIHYRPPPPSDPKGERLCPPGSLDGPWCREGALHLSAAETKWVDRGTDGE